VKRCPACGQLQPDDDEFCDVDGRRLISNLPSTDPPPPSAIANPRLASRTHTGLMRMQNQDAVASMGSPAGDWQILVVCDGVSSSTRSGYAAQLVAREVAEALSRQIPPARPADALREAIEGAHLSLCNAASAWGGEALAGTTIVAALVLGRQVTVGWVGDSRAYWVSPSTSELLTRDHSWCQEIIARGEMTEEEAYASPNAHAITRCMGPLEGPSVSADTTEHQLSGPGTLILCSDGLWNYLATPDSLADLLRHSSPSADDTARLLIDFALARGGMDNVSVAVGVIL